MRSHLSFVVKPYETGFIGPLVVHAASGTDPLMPCFSIKLEMSAVYKGREHLWRVSKGANHGESQPL